jgi:hypothetical protein
MIRVLFVTSGAAPLDHACLELSGVACRLPDWIALAEIPLLELS